MTPPSGSIASLDPLRSSSLRRGGEQTLRRRQDVLVRFLVLAGIAVLVLVWTVCVFLLVRGVVNWWAELQVHGLDAAAITGWDLMNGLE